MPAKKTKPKSKTSKSTKSKAKATSNKKNAAPHEFFFFADGRAAKNVKELAFMLDDIAGDVFVHHVNEHKNDFADWVSDVFDEKKLAEVLKTHKEIAKLQMELFRYLAKRSN